MAESWRHRTMRDILRVLFTRWLSGLLIVVLVVAAVGVATGMMPRIYQARVTLMSPLTQAEKTLTGEIRSDSVWEVVLKTQFEILMGDTVLGRTLARADNPALKRRPDMDSLRSTESLGPAAAATAEAVAPERLARINQAKDEADAIAAAAGEVPQRRLARFRRQIRMEVPGGPALGKSQIFSIYVRVEEEPALAKKLADLLSEEFVFRYHELVLQMLHNRLKAAQNGLVELALRYNPVRQAYADFLDQRGALGDLAHLISLIHGPLSDVGSGRVQTAARESLTRIRSEREGLEALRDAVAVLLADIEQQKGTVKDQTDVHIPIPEEIRRNNPAVRTYSEQLADKVAAYVSMKQVYEAQYKPLQDLLAEIVALQRQLTGVLQAGRKELEARIKQLQRQESSYAEASLPSLAAAVQPGQAGQTLTRMQELDSEWTTLQDFRQRQLAEYNQARLEYENALTVQKIQASDKAAQPDRSIRPIVWLNMLIAIVVGVLLALTYLFLADFYDHSVKSIDEVERYLGVPVLASVGRIGRRPVRA